MVKTMPGMPGFFKNDFPLKRSAKGAERRICTRVGHKLKHQINLPT
jgi:hypothetical protein